MHGFVQFVVGVLMMLSIPVVAVWEWLTGQRKGSGGSD